tara:strand:- start:332 stop:742 length:411 start_codon:yes stop_codon:yes gene_type:complete
MMNLKAILLCLVLGLMFSGTLLEKMPAAAAANNEVCEELPVDLWIRPSNDEDSLGRLMYLDMSKGWAGTDGENVIISVADISTGNIIMLIFPLNDWFEMDYSQFFPEEKPEEEKEFNWEEYLKQNKGTEIKKLDYH